MPGLAIDNDLRWMIVGRLACLGRDAGPRIEAQLATDDTDFGRRRAAACRAAQPEAAAKRAAFDLVVEGTELPLQMQHALMGGFGVGPFAVGGLVQWGERQTALLRPYVERWIEAVPRFWARRSSEEAESFTEFLYPRELVEPETLAAADRALAAIQAPPTSPSRPGAPPPGRSSRVGTGPRGR